MPRRVPEASEHTATLGDQPVFWRSGDSRSGTSGAPVLYLHGVPDSSDQWVPFLQRTGGLAPDLPGFGRSGKSGGNDYTIEGYARFVEAFLALAGVERVRLVVHDWGAAGLAWAQRSPERVERLVVVNGVPLLHGFRWRGPARLVRTPFIGPVVVGSATKRVLRAASRRATPAPGPMPEPFVANVAEYFDMGTERAVLTLLRSASPSVLARAGERLGELQAPALV
ncbi:MAG: hypothetical protein QOF04_840, partial [Solirubrobacteraceae bacterium]|nr:hypothetical protein [Solirubrobacteraceae bacterium]